MSDYPIDDPAALKALGVMQQKSEDLYSVRLCGMGGEWSAGDLRAAADLAERYAAGVIHLTVRQGLEIPDVPQADLEALLTALAEARLRVGGVGSRVRGIVACPGGRCRRGLIDSAETARALQEAVGDRADLPHKFKIAVAGCPSCCAKPQENDFGVQGAPGQTFRLHVGGRMGRSARLGQLLPIELPDLPSLCKAAGAAIDWYAEHGRPKERFGLTIDRVGAESLHRRIAAAMPAADTA